ncbi:MAG: hypothetical protein KatS3mg112_0635 [Thermogutta sp.]|nr:MAG: hypothetical protein KatS3mg112_0635 [Thermogutta sp.]
MSETYENRGSISEGEGKIYLSIDEANALIPRIEPLVRRMVDLARDLQARYERLAAIPAARRERHPLYKDELADIEAGIRRDFEKLKEWVDELASLGAITKSPVEGIIDFYSQYNGRDIFLCWRLGEPQIEFWHEVDAGFAGRRPVCELLESSTT